MTSITHQELFAQYQVIRILGEGSFGKVFLIRHEESEKQFAMKKYSKYHIFKNGKENSLIRSARILQALSHPGIIDFVHFIIGEEDEIFLIYQACKKGSLQEIKPHLYKTRDMILIKEIMHQLGQALKYLKSVAVAHRDIKPSNLTFNSDGCLKVVDFDEAVCFKEGAFDRKIGFGEALEIETSTLKLYSRRSRANSYVGTEIYMAPQMKNHTIADEQCDIWAYGCILFQLLSGQTFAAEIDDQEQLRSKIKGILMSLLKQLEKNNIEQPSIVIDLLEKVLQPNPKNRLPIQQILKHPFFNQYKIAQVNESSRKRLRKFLRGNYSLSSPQGVVDAINMDLIGMSGAYQKFQAISKIPIYVKCFGKQVGEHKSLIKQLHQIWQWIVKVPQMSLNLLIGGSRYFKVKNPTNQNDKIYIFYDQIESIKIVRDKILIDCKVQSSWGHKNAKWMEWTYQIMHLSDCQDSLGKLYQILIYILND